VAELPPCYIKPMCTIVTVMKTISHESVKTIDAGLLSAGKPLSLGLRCAPEGILGQRQVLAATLRTYVLMVLAVIKSVLNAEGFLHRLQVVHLKL
jgi:hypothetical protein